MNRPATSVKSTRAAKRESSVAATHARCFGRVIDELAGPRARRRRLARVIAATRGLRPASAQISTIMRAFSGGRESTCSRSDARIACDQVAAAAHAAKNLGALSLIGEARPSTIASLEGK